MAQVTKIQKISKYKGVTFRKAFGTYHARWVAQHKMPRGNKWSISKNTEREAALAYDKKMIELGKQPVNILIKKSIK